mgnify:CR=1 FL=1
MIDQATAKTNKSKKNKNERVFYAPKYILNGLKNLILEHPSFNSKEKYVNVNFSRRGNLYLSYYYQDRFKACSAMWFSGTAERFRIYSKHSG